jgi:tetratricopeptide (TPR) repeat protein
METMTTSYTPAKVFFSYAEADAPLVDLLDRQLSVLRHTGEIVGGHKRPVVAGNNRQEQVNRDLNTALLILVFVSPDFLCSDYLYRVELPQALKRHQANEARVIPILLRPCEWTGTSLADLQLIPRNLVPLTLWPDYDEGCAEVVREIRASLANVRPMVFGGNPAALPEVWQVPYGRNPAFTGREKLLKELQGLFCVEQTATHPQVQALCGLGGVGKTQIAVEYAYRAALHYRAVFWVTAETQEALTSGYAGLALALNLPGKDEQDHLAIIPVVRHWLQTHNGWLLILDNIDDLAWLSPLLPPSYGGQVLLTTRTQIAGRTAHRLEVPVLSSDEGALLLLRRSGKLAGPGTFDDMEAQIVRLARQISQELGNLPLALDQAGAYIEETGCGLQRYLDEYQKRQAELLARRGQLASDYPLSVATAWDLSFEKVERRQPLAAQILRLCSFLAPDAIPEELVEHALYSGLLVFAQAEVEQEEGSALSPFSMPLDELLAVLRCYSLIQRNDQQETLAMHRLVQTVLRAAMSEEERCIWVERAMRMFQARLPDIVFENWQQCEQYLPHAQECIQLAVGSSVGQARVLYWIGDYLLERWRTQEAQWYVQQSLRFRKQYLGMEHLDTAASLNNLASLYQLQGRYAEAEPLYERALLIREQQLGAEHPDTAASRNNLASLYRQQGRYTEAEPLYKRALLIREQQLGAEHPDTAASRNNLAGLYESQGRYAEAEPLYKRALLIREQQLGAEHPDTATSRNNLAGLYESQGRYAEAEPLYKRALLIREQQLGAEHPSTATSRNNLAGLYGRQGRYAEAEPLYKRALLTMEQQLGAEHPDTAASLDNLAGLYQQQGRYAEAEPLCKRALLIREQQLGAEHPDTATSRNNLAGLYQQQGRYAEAEPLYKRALLTMEQQLGAEHPDTAASRNNLAGLYQQQGRYAEAEPLYRRAYHIFLQRLGKEHPYTQSTLGAYTLLCQQEVKPTKKRKKRR